MFLLRCSSEVNSVLSAAFSLCTVGQNFKKNLTCIALSQQGDEYRTHLWMDDWLYP